MKADDETATTDIEIGPDGRIYIFGASRAVLEVMHDIGVSDSHLEARLQQMSQLAAPARQMNTRQDRGPSHE